jgi:hypothetical protein
LAQLFSFARKAERQPDWSQSEIAELYRIEHALLQASFVLETDRGVTDEGDPWFVFCRGDGEVLVHITRVEGQYHLFSAALARPLSGRLISELSKSFVERVPVLSPVRRGDTKVFVHPASMLAILIGTIFVAFDDVGLPVSPDSGTTRLGNEVMDRSAAGNDVRSMLHAAFASYAEVLSGASHSDELRDETHRGNSYFGIVCAVAAAIGAMAPSGDFGMPIAVSAPEMVEGYFGSLLPADELNLADWIETVDQIPQNQMAHDILIADSTVVDADSEAFQKAVPKAQIDVGSAFTVGQSAEATLTVRLDGDMEFAQVRISRSVGDFAADRTVSSDRSQAALPDEGVDGAHGVRPAEKLQVQFRLADIVVDHGRSLSVTIDGLLHEFLKSISAPGENDFAGALRVSARGGNSDQPGPDLGGVLAFPRYDADAQDILTAFLKTNPQSQVAFDHQNLIVYDGNLNFDSVRPVSVRIWEFDSGNTIAIVGYADEIGVHI